MELIYGLEWGFLGLLGLFHDFFSVNPLNPKP